MSPMIIQQKLVLQTVHIFHPTAKKKWKKVLFRKPLYFCSDELKLLASGDTCEKNIKQKKEKPHFHLNNLLLNRR